jgi:SAM-dependent methyltransferase
LLKLNLGSGAEKFAGWSSLDSNADVHPDYVADVRKIPLEDNSVDEIFASHVLEHTEWRDDVLKEWERVLKPGGKIMVAVPDLLQLIAFQRAGIVSLEYFYATIYGSAIMGDKRPNMTHFQVFTPDLLMERMRAYFRDVKNSSDGAPRPGYYGEMVVTGWKA